jgi:hypothetical protein
MDEINTPGGEVPVIKNLTAVSGSLPEQPCRQTLALVCEWSPVLETT